MELIEKYFILICHNNLTSLITCNNTQTHKRKEAEEEIKDAGKKTMNKKTKDEAVKKRKKTCN